jgi:hypothetical protein
MRYRAGLWTSACLREEVALMGNHDFFEERAALTGRAEFKQRLRLLEARAALHTAQDEGQGLDWATLCAW